MHKIRQVSKSIINSKFKLISDCINMALYKTQWRHMIHVTNLDILDTLGFMNVDVDLSNIFTTKFIFYFILNLHTLC